MIRRHKVSLFILVLAAIWVFALLTAAQAFAIEGGTPDPPACDPQIQASSVAPFWASYNDFLGRRLSVRESLQNIGGCQPCAIDVSNIEADNGVTVDTPLPIGVGELPDAATGSIMVSYHVPPGVNRFRVHLRAVCRPVAPPPPPENASYVMHISPPHAYAMGGCPTFVAIPPEEEYGPKRFTVTVLDLNGAPTAGRPVSWTLTDPLGFTFDASGSTFVTDEAGRAFVTVWPPFGDYVPQSGSSTLVIAATEAALPVQADFGSMYCGNPGPKPVNPSS